MSWLNDVSDVLENDFRVGNGVLEEEDAAMKVEIDNRGCKAIFYKFDKELSRAYKGGLFPFFAKKKGVCKICDCLIFAERNAQSYILLVELKKGRQQTMPQLDAAECFANYIKCTANRVAKKQHKPIIRKISVREFLIKKKRTKQQEVTYDHNNHCDLYNGKLYVADFLK